MKIFKRTLLLAIAFLIFLPLSKTFAIDITFDQKIGANGFVDNDQNNFSAIGVLREYHNFGWTYDYNTGKTYYQSSWFDFDNFYKSVYDKGITVAPCIQQGIDPNNRENKPVTDFSRTTDPTAYGIHSNVLFNFAARYGSRTVSANKLNLNSGVEAKSGLGYVKYVENWNEPDKTWQGANACFSPEEFAAMCSADYDGHEGTMGDTYGIKQADPSMKLVYGGLAGGSAGVDYLNRMKAWSEENRTGKDLPFDVINFHMYCGTHSPEKSDFVTNASQIVNWRNTYAKDKEVWLTEFGWDTNPNSQRTAGTYERQRDWIVREFLIADKIGIDRSTVFTMRNDGAETSTGNYGTCGLTMGKGNESERKASWYGVNTLKAVLKDCKLDKLVLESADRVYIYRYKNQKTNEHVYVLWCPTENGSKIDEFTLSIQQRKNNKATITNLKDKEPLGETQVVDIVDNKITFEVTESPVFVTVPPIYEEEPVVKTRINSSNVTLSKYKYQYNGKIRKPAVTVRANGKVLTRNTDYKVAWYNNDRPGKAKVVVKGIGDYEGRIEIPFEIKPTQITNLQASINGSTLKMNWNHSESVTGYQVQYTTDPTFNKITRTKTIKEDKKKITFTNLPTAMYYVRVRAYTQVGNERIYSLWKVY